MKKLQKSTFIIQFCNRHIIFQNFVEIAFEGWKSQVWNISTWTFKKIFLSENPARPINHTLNNNNNNTY